MSPSYPAGLVPSGARGRGEDRVAAYAPPDDVCLPGQALLAVTERGTAVRCPGHLEDAAASGGTEAHSQEALAGGRGRRRLQSVIDELLAAARSPADMRGSPGRQYGHGSRT